MKTWPAKLAIATLIITIFPLEYGLYFVGKTIVCLVSLYYLFKIRDQKAKQQINFYWYFFGAAVLFNPIIPIYLFIRLAWIVVDVIFIAIFIKFLNSKHACVLAT